MNLASKPDMGVSRYHSTFTKRLMDIILSFLGILISLPLFLLISLLIKLTSTGPVFFLHNRSGKYGQTFKMFKFRTMVKNAEKLQLRYRKLNEADGPVFKIKNDPRFTNLGKILSHTGLDELPQLINILKGEMSFIGPRPLPVEEANKVPKYYKARLKIKPGLTSLWVVMGSHNLTFKQWMDLDLKYVKSASFFEDIKIFFMTILLVVKFSINILKQ